MWKRVDKSNSPLRKSQDSLTPPGMDKYMGLQGFFKEGIYCWFLYNSKITDKKEGKKT